MAKLFSWKEARKIANTMCKECGLAPPEIEEFSYGYSDTVKVKVTIRSYISPTIFGIKRTQKDYSFNESNLESAIVGLEEYLKKTYTDRTETAEVLREKYAIQEVNQLLDEVLRT
jgi:hypothetical protein